MRRWLIDGFDELEAASERDGPRSPPVEVFPIMPINALELSGLLEILPRRFEDERGYFTKCFEPTASKSMQARRISFRVTSPRRGAN